MSEPPDVLIQHARYALEALGHSSVCGTKGDNSLLWSTRTLGTTSMFSGICCAERALESINAARKTFGADIGDLTATRKHGVVGRGMVLLTTVHCRCTVDSLFAV